MTTPSSEVREAAKIILRMTPSPGSINEEDFTKPIAIHWPTYCAMHTLANYAASQLAEQPPVTCPAVEGEAFKALYATVTELLQAMVDYQMDVDEEPPRKHRDMMQRATAALRLAEGGDQ